MRAAMYFILLSLLSTQLFSQTAPAHLKYFGFALVDMLWDDPHDTATTTNYIAEVDSFSNIAQLGVYDFDDDINARINLMNTHCVKPFLSIQSVCYYETDTLAPSGHHFALYPDFRERWNSFKAINQFALDSSKVGAFYVADEPVWNGIGFPELDTICQMIKNDFQNIPIMFVEAYPVLSSLIVPQSVDWVGFDRYGIFDPATSGIFLNDLDTLKSKLSTSDQKIFLIIDDQWLPYYGEAGFSPDTIRFMVQNYYDLAASDSSIIGLIGYLWAGGLDDPEQLGVRDMPESVKAKNVEIGKMIKAIYSPCEVTGIQDIEKPKLLFSVFPNPANESLTIDFPDNETNKTLIQIFNSTGMLLIETLISQSTQINITDLPDGIYFVHFKGNPQLTIKFIKQEKR